VFIGNEAFGSPSDSLYGSGIAGGDGGGGAICSAGQLNVEGSTFDSNGAQGGVGASGTGSSSLSSPNYAGAGGSANGGAIFVLGTASVSDSTFVRNVVAGGGMGGFGIFGGWGAMAVRAAPPSAAFATPMAGWRSPIAPSHLTGQPVERAEAAFQVVPTVLGA